MIQLIGAIFLIAGTTIGGAMIALPVASATLGLQAALLQFFLCWVFMTFSALYFLERLQYEPVGTNLFTLAHKTYPKFGAALVWLSYMVLLYALTAVYGSGMADWLNEISIYLGFSDSFIRSLILFHGFAFIILITGIRGIDSINKILFLIMMLTFALLIFFVFPKIHAANLEHPFNFEISALPLLVTAFGFHIIIPSLFKYLKADVQKLRTAILIGSVLPIVVYVVWIVGIMGIIPLEGQNGLLAIGSRGHPAHELTTLIPQILDHKDLRTLLRCFSFCALATSFLGVSLSLFDCLKDSALKKLNKPFMSLLVLLPPFLTTLIYPNVFIFALHFAGLFVAFLLGVFPAHALLQIRKSHHQTLAGPTFWIYITMLFFISVIAIEIYNLI